MIAFHFMQCKNLSGILHGSHQIRKGQVTISLRSQNNSISTLQDSLRVSDTGFELEKIVIYHTFEESCYFWEELDKAKAFQQAMKAMQYYKSLSWTICM